MSLLGWIQRWRQTQARCRELEAENRQLKERHAWLEAQMAELQTKNTQLVGALAAAKKNSSTSSKPPSSDIVKPPAHQRKRTKKSKRRIGGQKGHPKHEHTPFPPDQVDKHIPYRLSVCPVQSLPPHCPGGGPKANCAAD